MTAPIDSFYNPHYLPPQPSIADMPLVAPGEQLTPEQQEELSIAQVAAITTAVAAAKQRIIDAATNQIVAILRTSNLATKAGIKTFAKSAAAIVTSAIRQSQMVTWSATTARTRAMGLTFSAALPSLEVIPKSRRTDLETAYARIADEYWKNVRRKKDDPVIKRLLVSYEKADVLPTKPLHYITPDAKQPKGEVRKENWEELIEQAEKRLKGSGKKEGKTEGGSYAQPTRSSQDQGVEKAGKQSVPTDLSKRQDQDSKLGSKDVSKPSEDQITQSKPKDSSSESVPFLSPRDEQQIIRTWAEQKAEERLERMVSQDVQAASRNTHHEAMKRMPKNKVKGYRRVIHPELSKSGESCGLCVVASTMMYTREDLLPIHANCHCEVAEIVEVDGKIIDPGQAINDEDLEVFYNEVGGSTSGKLLKRGRFKVVDHPEYGPTLVSANAKPGEEEYVEYIGAKG